MPRKNPHLPQFHKGPHVLRDAASPKRRRAHRIFAQCVVSTPTILAKAESRRAVYMHATARRRAHAAALAEVADALAAE